MDLELSCEKNSTISRIIAFSLKWMQYIFISEFRAFFPPGKYAQFQCIQKLKLGASLVAQWLRICLPMQGTRVRALVWEDPTCRGATKPVCHNY